MEGGFAIYFGQQRRVLRMSSVASGALVLLPSIIPSFVIVKRELRRVLKIMRLEQNLKKKINSP